MAGDFGMEFSIDNRSAAFLDQLEKDMAKEMRVMGKDVTAEMAAQCPKSEKQRMVYRGKDLAGDDAKHLADTIKFEIKKKGGVIVMKAGAGKFTANFLVLGTVRMAARDFVNPPMRRLEAFFGARVAAVAEKVKV